MKKLLLIQSLLLLMTCGFKSENRIAKVTASLLPIENLFSSIPESEIFNYDSFRIEALKKGNENSDFWETGLTEIKYKVYNGSTLLTTIEIESKDFQNMFNSDFGQNARIWNSDLLAFFPEDGKIIISNRFGLPESDNETFVICVADFKGNKSFLDSPPGCASDLNVSFKKIVNCSGVYEYTKPIHEFTSCCTVYARLINQKTLFYVIDWKDINSKNAFFINIETKDTLEAFNFKGFYEGLGYNALINYDQVKGVLVLLDLKENTLKTWDKKLKKIIYDLKKIQFDSKLVSSSNTLEMYDETLEEILIEFDKGMNPLKINKQF
jgi:hypothetical protein